MTPDVIRWHCHPNPALRNSRDTVSGHQARVALLCNQFAVAIGLPDDRRAELVIAGCGGVNTNERFCHGFT